MPKIISDEAIKNRLYWIDEVKRIGSGFEDNTKRLLTELESELKEYGGTRLVDHLRLCGDIPESYGHDSSEEKQYSKYTDALLSESFKYIGLKSLIYTERADAADVEAAGNGFSFVADAKAFRLSRTAKNQKDFKVQAMDGWRRTHDYAMVVCPIYQLPVRSSQIYQQATSKNVCIFTYSHLSVLVSFCMEESAQAAEELILEIFKTIPLMNTSKDSTSYWLAINKSMLNFSKKIESLWKMEKEAAVESVKIAKELALNYLSYERKRIMLMSHQDALNELIKINRIDSRIETISSLTNNSLLELC